MGGKDDKHQADIGRQRDAGRKRHGDDRGYANDDPLLHPANEGHDEERARDRLEDWASEELGRGPDAQRLRELEERERRAQAAGQNVDGPDTFEEAPVKMHGSPYNLDENIDEHHARAGEPKKHPRRREETTPEPGRGPHAEHKVTGEPPDVRVRAGGQVEYEHGQVPPRKGSNEGT